MEEQCAHICADVFVKTKTAITSIAYQNRGTLKLGCASYAANIYLDAPEIDRPIAALEDLRDKVAALAKEGSEDDA